MIVYIAGPMRGIKRYNALAFWYAARNLRHEHPGVFIIDPHEEDKKNGFFVHELPEDHDWNSYPPNFDKEACFQRCIDAVRSCDAIYMLNGWEQSTGAKAERALAEWMGKKVMYEDTHFGMSGCTICGKEQCDCFAGKLPCERCGEPVFPDDTTHFCHLAKIAELRKETPFGGFYICGDCGGHVKNGMCCQCTREPRKEDIFRGGLGAEPKEKTPAYRCPHCKYEGDDFAPDLLHMFVRYCPKCEATLDVADCLVKAPAHNPENKGVAGGKPSNAENPKDAIGSGKLPIHLWPTTATMVGCIGFLNGMLKYGRANFRAVGVRSSIYYDACRRHIDAWFEGEDIDPDDNVPHLSAALCCLAIIVDAQAAGKLNDDRNFPGGYRKLRDELSPLVAMLKEKHAEKNPKHYTIGDTNG